MSLQTKVTSSVKDGFGQVERIIQGSGTEDEGSPAPISNTIQKSNELLDENEFETTWDKYDKMVSMDAELAGAVNAMAQSATNFTIENSKKNPTSLDEDAKKECIKLSVRINLDLLTIDIFRNLLQYGNDINKMVYSTGDGIQLLQSLPIKAVTIVDSKDDIIVTDSEDRNDIISNIIDKHPDLGERESESGQNEVFERGLYILNEEIQERERKTIEPKDILHFAIDYRSNWHEDRVGRDTYGVWGKSRLEPLEYALKVKYNTLNNKVAMDDKLVAREIYYVDTKALFGDIPDRKERKKKAEAYVTQLKQNIEDLGPDERPALPEEVSVEVIGPEGKAIDQTNFIEQQNNSTAAALTFPMAGLGRGTTSVKAGEEISSLWAENNIRNLRQTIVGGVKQLFKIHLLTVDEKFRKNGGEDISQMELVDDVTIPTLKHEPFKEDDRTQKTRQIERLRRQKVITAEEAREMFGLDTDEGTIEQLREEYNGILDPTVKPNAE